MVTQKPDNVEVVPQKKHSRSFWKTRAGAVFTVFLVLIGFMLAYEHRAHIFTGTGLLLLVVLLCPVMHLFMHHGHGGRDK